MKNLLRALCCMIVSKILLGVEVNNLMITIFIGYFALIIGIVGTLCFAAIFIYDIQS
jgi:hypothetical protein